MFNAFHSAMILRWNILLLSWKPEYPPSRQVPCVPFRCDPEREHFALHRSVSIFLHRTRCYATNIHTSITPCHYKRTFDIKEQKKCNYFCLEPSNQCPSQPYLGYHQFVVQHPFLKHQPPFCQPHASHAPSELQLVVSPC
jgi:hypothetical protein